MTKQPLVFSVGEVLWDLLPDGKQLGGAAANLAFHAHALGARAVVASRVGDDEQGREILARLDALGMPTYGIAVDREAPTGTVSVALDSDGRPTFTIREHVAWDCIEAHQRILEDAGRAEVICFSTLAQRSSRSHAAIRRLLLASPEATLRLFDINLRQRFWSKPIIEESFRLADAVKLNDEELEVVADLFRLAGGEEARMRSLADRFNLKAVALTKGARGSSLLLHGEYHCQHGKATRVIDTVGAGDGFAAVLALGVIGMKPANTILQCAGDLAEFICGCPGAMPPIDETLRQRIGSELGLIPPAEKGNSYQA